MIENQLEVRVPLGRARALARTTRETSTLCGETRYPARRWDHKRLIIMVADPVIARLIDKIAVDPNQPPYPDRFPHHHGATVTITLKDGRRFADHVDVSARLRAPRNRVG